MKFPIFSLSAGNCTVQMISHTRVKNDFTQKSRSVLAKNCNSRAPSLGEKIYLTNNTIAEPYERAHTHSILEHL